MVEILNLHLVVRIKLIVRKRARINIKKDVENQMISIHSEANLASLAAVVLRKRLQSSTIIWMISTIFAKRQTRLMNLNYSGFLRN